MRIDATTLRRGALWVAALPATAIASQFIVALADEWGWFKDPSKKVAILFDLLARLVHSTGFHWGAGIAFGFAAGAWLDAIMRRNESLPSKQGEHESAVDWFAPAQARLRFVDAAHRNDIEEIEGEIQKHAPAVERARLEASDESVNPLAREIRLAAFQDLATHQSMRTDQRNKLIREADLEIMRKLRQGEILARGLEVIAGVASSGDTIIPKELWRALALQVEIAEAGGNGRRYVGIEIGRP